MKLKNNTQLVLDLIVSGFFALISMIIIRFIIPEGLTAKFLLLGSKLVGVILAILIIIFLISWFFNKKYEIIILGATSSTRYKSRWKATLFNI